MSLRESRPGLALELAQTLARGGYTEKAIRERISDGEPYAEQMTKLPLFLHRSSELNELNVFIRLFTLGVEVSDEAVRECFGSVSLDDLAESGIIEGRDGLVAPLIEISEMEGLTLAHDPELEPGSRKDLVLGPTPSSQTVATLMVTSPVDRALDIGTGGGVLGLMAARYATEVVGTEISTRAIEFADFNAAMNGVTNLEVREGSFFEPVEGELFDLVVCNPPFVVSPDAAFQFRDSGFPADGVSEHVVTGAAAHLGESGYASIICSWVHRGEEDWTQRPAGWVEGLGCDAWILKLGTSDPVSYAASWNIPSADDYENSIERWVGYYESEGITGISAGCIILRRRTGTNWVRTDLMPKATTAPLTSYIRTIFSGESFLNESDTDSALLEAGFSLTPNHGLQQKFAYSKGKYLPTEMTLHITEGMHFSGSVDNLTLKLLGRLEKGATLREAIAAISSEAGSDPDSVAPSVVQMVRQLVGLGFLIPR